MYASVYDVAMNNWGAPSLLEFDDAGDAFTPQVRLDSGGNAIAMWYQDNGAQASVRAARYDQVTGWSPAVLLDDGAEVELGIDAAGNARAVWMHTRTGAIFSDYRILTTWGPACGARYRNSTPRVATRGFLRSP